MSDNVVFSVLSNHFFNYTKRYQPDIELFEIEDFLIEWLPRIQAPMNARGISIVLGNIREYTQDAEFKKKLQDIFKLPNWFLPALEFELSGESKLIRDDISNKHMADGWCEHHPFYAWLFSAMYYARDNKAQTLQISFIEQYYNQLTVLQDTAYSTSTKSREQEICSATRLLFDRKNKDMALLINSIDRVLIKNSPLLAQKITIYCKSDDSKIEPKNIGYLRSVTHFLLEDWPLARQHHFQTQVQRRYSKRYNKTVRSSIQGNDETLLELLPAIAGEITQDGLEPDDLFSQQHFVVEDADCEKSRDKRETTDPRRVFDFRLQKRKAVNITAKVRRGQNVSLQNTELLKSAELANFIHFLRKIENRKDPAEHHFVLSCWLMLLIGKTYDELLNLFVFDSLQDITQGLYVDRQGDGWWCFPVEYSAKPRFEDENKGLIPTQGYVFTPCPSFLLPLCKRDYASGCRQLLNPNITTEMFQQRLRSYSDKCKAGGRVTHEKLTNFMQRFCFASGCIDPVVLDFSYRLALTQTRVTRSYASLADDVRQDALYRMWKMIRRDIATADPDLSLPEFFESRPWENIQSVGSTFTPSNKTCCELTASLVHRIENSAPSRVYSFDEIIRYHNSYVLFTAYLLMFATGYRAVNNPLPSLSLHLKRYRLLAISDKDDEDFTHARLVCVPQVLAEQLCNYEEHLRRLAELIRYRKPELALIIDRLLWQDERLLTVPPTQAAEWYKTVKNSRKILGPLFLFKQQNDQWNPINIAPKDLLREQPENLQLPANAGRHWIKSELIKRQVEPEWIDWQMGHWMTGQAPLAYYSAFNHVEVSFQMGLILDEMLREVGWKSLTSKLISTF